MRRVVRVGLCVVAVPVLLIAAFATLVALAPERAHPEETEYVQSLLARPVSGKVIDGRWEKHKVVFWYRTSIDFERSGLPVPSLVDVLIDRVEIYGPSGEIEEVIDQSSDGKTRKIWETRLGEVFHEEFQRLRQFRAPGTQKVAWRFF